MSDLRQLEADVCGKLGIGPRWLVNYRSGPRYDTEPPGEGSGLPAMLIETPPVATSADAFELVVEKLGERFIITFWKSILRQPDPETAWHASIESATDKHWGSGADHKEAVCRAVLAMELFG